jgi:hypothetical protein
VIAVVMEMIGTAILVNIMGRMINLDEADHTNTMGACANVINEHQLHFAVLQENQMIELIHLEPFNPFEKSNRYDIYHNNKVIGYVLIDVDDSTEILAIKYQHVHFHGNLYPLSVSDLKALAYEIEDVSNELIRI